MKKALLTILAGMPALVFAQTTPAPNFTVKGKVGNIGAPSKVFLQYRADGKTIIDSTVAVNGAFTFTGTVKDVTPASVIYDPQGTGLAKLDRKTRIDVGQVYLAPGTTNINSADSLYKAKVTGTKIAEENEAYKAFMKPVNDKWSELSKWYQATPADKRKEKSFDEQYEAKSDAIDKESKKLATSFVKAKPGSYFAMQALQSALGYYPEYTEAAPMFAMLSAEAKASAQGKAYATKMEKWKTVAMGAVAPEFSQADTAGKMVSLSSFRGKYVLIDFWASWCGPCRAENPNVVAAFNKYKDKNFTVLGISLDQPGKKDLWLEAIHKDGLNWTQLSDLKFWNNEVSTAYGIGAIPQNILIDPSGKIVGKSLSGKNLTDKLEALLGKI